MDWAAANARATRLLPPHPGLPWHRSGADAKVRDNMRSALERNIPLEIRAIYAPNGDTLSVMAGGPSLARTWRQAEGKVIAVNGVHNWLVERGMVPWACCLLDVNPDLRDWILPRDDVIYFVASMADPETFDHLAGRHVVLWHASGPGGVDAVLNERSGDWLLVGGGTTVALRCLNLGYILGYRRFRFFGLDSSYENGVSHAYHHETLPTVTVEAGGREFVTQAGFARQVMDFCSVMDGFTSGRLTGKPESLDVQVIGDGLLPTLLAEFEQSRSHDERTNGEGTIHA